MAAVSSDGYAIGVRLLSEAVRPGDSQMFKDRATSSLASITHDGIGPVWAHSTAAIRRQRQWPRLSLNSPFRKCPHGHIG